MLVQVHTRKSHCRQGLGLVSYALDAAPGAHHLTAAGRLKLGQNQNLASALIRSGTLEAALIPEFVMSLSEFEGLLAAAMPISHRTAITLTELPADESNLFGLLDRAIVAGNRHNAPLAEVHAPIDLYRTLANAYWHVPIEDSGRDGVVRLVFAANTSGPGLAA